MSNQKVYLVDESSGDGNRVVCGIYTSYELAIQAMKDLVAEYKDYEERLTCYEVLVDNPSSDWEILASYEDNEWIFNK